MYTDHQYTHERKPRHMDLKTRQSLPRGKCPDYTSVQIHRNLDCDCLTAERPDNRAAIRSLQRLFQRRIPVICPSCQGQGYTGHVLTRNGVEERVCPECSGGTLPLIF